MRIYGFELLWGIWTFGTVWRSVAFALRSDAITEIPACVWRVKMSDNGVCEWEACRCREISTNPTPMLFFQVENSPDLSSVWLELIYTVEFSSVDVNNTFSHFSDYNLFYTASLPPTLHRNMFFSIFIWRIFVIDSEKVVSSRLSLPVLQVFKVFVCVQVTPMMGYLIRSDLSHWDLLFGLRRSVFFSSDASENCSVWKAGAVNSS